MGTLWRCGHRSIVVAFEMISLSVPTQEYREHASPMKCSFLKEKESVDGVDTCVSQMALKEHHKEAAPLVSTSEVLLQSASPRV